jgi:hypothetical protein
MFEEQGSCDGMSCRFDELLLMICGPAMVTRIRQIETIEERRSFASLHRRLQPTKSERKVSQEENRNGREGETNFCFLHMSFLTSKRSP